MNSASKLTILTYWHFFLLRLKLYADLIKAHGFSFLNLINFIVNTLKITQTDQKPTFKQFDDYLYTVCNFQSMKSPLELNSLLSKFFCYITWLLYQLIRRDSGRLAHEAFTSNAIVSSKQWLNGLKITNCIDGLRWPRTLDKFKNNLGRNT